MVMHPRQLIALTFVLLGISFAQDESSRGDPNIYLVVTKECGNGQSAALTGFTLKGVDGLITALHGVADCLNSGSIEASNPHSSNALSDNLELVKADFEHDVALLKPRFKENDFESAGLPISSLETSDRSNLTVVGYPKGVRGQLRVGANPQGSGEIIYPLKDLITTDAFNDADKRGSPNIHKARVLILQSAISPGYSGAPVFDANQRVIAIGQGGIPGSEIGWATLWEDVNLIPVDDDDLKAKLETLATNPQLMNALFGVRTEQLPQRRTYRIQDINREHRYEFEAYERCEVKELSPDDG